MDWKNKEQGEKRKKERGGEVRIKGWKERQAGRQVRRERRKERGSERGRQAGSQGLSFSRGLFGQENGRTMSVKYVREEPSSSRVPWFGWEPSADLAVYGKKRALSQISWGNTA